MADLLLAIDTATNRIGLSLSTEFEILAESVWQSDRFHTVELAPRTAMMMMETGTNPGDLSGVVVASGPGSYTGLRIGMAFGKGLAMAHQIPLFGVSTLDGLARMQPERQEPMLATLGAGRGRIAAVWYKWGRSGWQAQGEPYTTEWDQVLAELVEPIYVSGEISAQTRRTLSRSGLVTLASPAMCMRRPSFLAELAREQAGSADLESAATLAPTYIGEV